MRRLVFAAACAALVSFPACKIQQTGRADSLVDGGSVDDRALAGEVRLAVTLARQLRANPDSAASILDAERITRLGLDSLLYRIAMDPDLAAQYDRATGRVNGALVE